MNVDGLDSFACFDVFGRKDCVCLCAMVSQMTRYMFSINVYDVTTKDLSQMTRYMFSPNVYDVI